MSERFRRENPTIGRRLSPELSKENPELYRQLTVERLRNTTMLSGKAWDLLKNQGIFDENSLILNPDSWVSETRIDPQNSSRKTITLGTESLSPEMRERLIFEDTHFTGDGEIVYRLSHEIGHEVGSEATSMSPRTRNLFEMVVKMRESGHAISSLGNLDGYRQMGPDVQASEDVVELINMYMIDPAYLERYLKFLSDPQFERQRQRLGLYTVPNERVSQMLLKSVEDGVVKFLNS